MFTYSSGMWYVQVNRGFQGLKPTPCREEFLIACSIGLNVRCNSFLLQSLQGQVGFISPKSGCLQSSPWVGYPRAYPHLENLKESGAMVVYVLGINVYFPKLSPSVAHLALNPVTLQLPGPWGWESSSTSTIRVLSWISHPLA